MRGRSQRRAVIIVGAGPVGLAAALELARHDVASVVLDRKNTLNDGSRAICVSRSSFETLQQLGVAGIFEDKSLGWTHGRCYYRDRMIYRMQMPHSDQERYLPMYNIQQQYIEQFLVERIAELPNLIDLRWQNEVLGVRAGDDAITLRVGTPAGEYQLEGQYLLAADGARSALRKMMGLKLEGENLPGHYVIADVQMQHDFPTERRSFFESSANPASTVLVHRQPDNLWRIDWQPDPHEDAEEALSETNVRQRVQDILDMLGHDGPWELEWWSLYTANTLCLDDYRHGRTLFVGDSAHIVPIFGVRGLNNGLADAVNAAWKVAYVLRGEAGEKLLDSYTPERRGATLDVFSNAGKSSRFMTPPTRGYALMRKAALQLSLTQDFAKRFADPRQVLPYTYADSPLNFVADGDGAFAGGVAPGSVATNRKTGAGGFLLDRLGTGFTGMYFNQRERLPDEVTALAARLQQIDQRFKMLIISDLPLQHEHFEVVVDELHNVFGGYAARDGSFYLLRPDRYVAGRWQDAPAQEIAEVLSRMLSRDER